MDHRPYEDYLLDDQRLTPAQEQDLQNHLRTCPDCAALAHANLALRAAPVAAPTKGFSQRFQTRLAAERQLQHRRAQIGSLLLALAGASLLAWLLHPYLGYLALPPETLFTLWFNHATYLVLLFRTAGSIALTLIHVAGALVPAYALISFLTLLAGLGVLLNFSVRRNEQFSQTAI